MRHCGTERIESERLILRPFSVDDAGAMYKNWAADPEVTKFLTWPPHEDADASKAVLTEWVDSYAKKDFYHKRVRIPLSSIGSGMNHTRK